MNQPNQVARLLRERRAKLGLSRPAARGALRHLPRDDREVGAGPAPPSLHDAMRLAHALGIPSYELAAATLNVSGNETGGPEISPQAARSLLETTMLVFDWDLDRLHRSPARRPTMSTSGCAARATCPSRRSACCAARLGPRLIDVARGEEADDGTTVGRARVRRIS